MTIAIVGLGKMGAQLANLIAQAGHRVIALDPNPEAVAAAVAFGAVAVNDRQSAIEKFEDEPVVVWLMIPAAFVSAEVDAWLEVLPAGSLLIDGGNTDFRETQKHAQLAAHKGVEFVDVGVSGGVLGIVNGFSMMVGGSAASYGTITPILDALQGSRGGHDYFGGAGSGHYVKMVHNAIEYGMMESLAEGYRLLREGPFQQLDLAKVGAIWQKASVIESTLNGLVAEIMEADQSLSAASGTVADSGEARWSLETAEASQIELPAIRAALDVRLASQQGETNYATQLLAELRNKFGGHPVNTKE